MKLFFKNLGHVFVGMGVVAAILGVLLLPLVWTAHDTHWDEIATVVYYCLVFAVTVAACMTLEERQETE